MITAKSLVKKFDGKTALDGITLTVNDGCIYGLIGSNGSGKSTLLRLIAGVYTKDGGELKIDDEVCFENPYIKSKIAFLGDTPYFLPQANLKDMANLYGSLYPDFDYEIYNYLLGVFPLNQNARISAFSKGMQRQASLILALSSNPKYLLLDEAFDGLDAVMRKVLANIIIDRVEKCNLTVIISSHNLRELENVCDHICLIHKGQIVSNSDIDSLRGNVHKIQVAFEKTPDLSVFESLYIIKTERTGSLLSMVVKGDEEKIMQFINRLSPLYAECIEPTLEEVFVYEMEAAGYDIKNILS